mmetsp:Transcript_3036/g.4792  ORF Transcript_3036/g.4792 Transcript_3036/m.4792 type:complete len:233 (-) Transcript_3036:3419-4117(-)
MRCGWDCKVWRSHPSWIFFRILFINTSASAESDEVALLPMVTNKASNKCQGSSHRSPFPARLCVKSSGSRPPIGKLSSDLRGCNTRSTSSINKAPCFHSWNTFVPTSICFLKVWTRFLSGFRLYCILSTSCINSTTFNAKALTAVGCEQTIARFLIAFLSLLYILCEMVLKRSKANVYTDFLTMALNFSLITPLDISSNALGTICVTRVLPSASINANKGPTTVVFPPPISI